MLRNSLYLLLIMVFMGAPGVKTDIAVAEDIQFSTQTIHCVSFSNPDPKGLCAKIIMHTKAGAVRAGEPWDSFYARRQHEQVKDIFSQADYNGDHGYAAALDADGDILLTMRILDIKLRDLNSSISEVFQNMDEVLNRPGILEQCALATRQLAWAEECVSRTKITCDIEFDGEDTQDEIVPFLATKEDIATAASMIKMKKGELLLSEDAEQQQLSPHDGSDGSSCTGQCNPGEIYQCG